jgi:hypothetical protein
MYVPSYCYASLHTVMGVYAVHIWLLVLKYLTVGTTTCIPSFVDVLHLSLVLVLHLRHRHLLSNASVFVLLYQ